MKMLIYCSKSEILLMLPLNWVFIRNSEFIDIIAINTVISLSNFFHKMKLTMEQNLNQESSTKDWPSPVTSFQLEVKIYNLVQLQVGWVGPLKS